MNNLKEMSVGDSIVINVNGSVDERIFKTKNGSKIKKNDQIKVINGSEKEALFYVHRIIGKDYLVLRERKNKPKLGLVDSLTLGWESAVRRSF